MQLRRMPPLIAADFGRAGADVVGLQARPAMTKALRLPLLGSHVFVRQGCIQRVVLVSCLLLLVGTVSQADEGESVKQRRMAFIEAILDRFEVETADDSAKVLTLSAAPTLKFTNPVRSATGSGATYFWLDGARPLAAMSASIRDNGKAFREMSLLQDIPLRATRDGKLVWNPKTVAKPWKIVPDTARPAKTEPQRLIQMRGIVRRFEMNIVKGDMESGSLRGLSKPIYRYSEPDDGILDAAVFAFVESTDPEALLVLEAHGDDAGGAWRYTIARMTSRPSEVLLDQREIWSTKAYWKNPRSKDDPYSEAYDSNYEEKIEDVVLRDQEPKISP